MNEEIAEKIMRIAHAVNGKVIPPNTSKMVQPVRHFTVGSGLQADVSFPNDVYMSTFHCRFYRDFADQTWVEDLGSTNGTWVNGIRIYAPILIVPGDVVRIGRTTLPWEK